LFCFKLGSGEALVNPSKPGKTVFKVIQNRLECL